MLKLSVKNQEYTLVLIAFTEEAVECLLQFLFESV